MAFPGWKSLEGKPIFPVCSQKGAAGKVAR
jgi:hypothetical protein